MFSRRRPAVFMHARHGTTPSSREKTAVVGTGIGCDKRSRRGNDSGLTWSTPRRRYARVCAAVARVGEAERAPERDHLAHDRRARASKFAREDAAQTPPHEADRPTRCVMQRFEPRGHSIENRRGGAEVAAELPPVHLVAKHAQIQPHRGGGGVFREQSGEDEDWVAVASRRAQQHGRRRQHGAVVGERAARLGDEQRQRWACHR